ncbi:MAG: sigma-70 family RNA polymerase sigma factor [Acidimicrobiia bacterium]|nr:sigma-70 family RNA polymerase sigma factor [Acidimicrobiia bacterium]
MRRELTAGRTEDRKLVARLRAHDSEAVAELASRYGLRIHQLAFRYMRNREDAQEVAQDVLLKVSRKIGAFRGDAALSSWIYRITFNTAMSRLRTSKAARAADAERDRTRADNDERRAARTARLADWSALPDEAVLRRELMATLAKEIRALPEIYRVPILLRDVEGLSTEEAGRKLRLKDQTLKSRLHRGRLMLRDRLRLFEGGLALHRRAIARPTRVADHATAA